MDKKNMTSRRILVIGGGPGGYVAAIRAAQLGAEVTLVEREKLGGVCLNVGCIPTKALLHSAQVYDTARTGAEVGVVTEQVRLDWQAVQHNRRSIVSRLTGGVSGLLAANGVQVIQGEACFTGPKTVSVNGECLAADRVIIAAGSRPAAPPIPGLDGPGPWLDSTGCIELDRLPESLLIIGGGVVGVELGHTYQAFGSKVMLVEQLPQILPSMDPELTALLRGRAEKQGMEIHTGTTVLRTEPYGSGAAVWVRDSGGEERRLLAEKVLVCTGRVPDTQSLCLAAAGIQACRGGISVNCRMETSQPGVYAIGDCTGTVMLAHAAMSMGEVAAENAMGGDAMFRPELCPSCVYVGPEFAGVGHTEERLKAEGVAYRVGRFPTSANGRCLTMGEPDGMVKILLGARYGEILGVHILAPSAGELIQEAALAMRLEATADELIDTIHGHPTVSEALREAALAAEGRAIHMPNTER